MSKNYNTPEFKSLLKRLQEESWQLELLISGFAIFGLFTALKPLKESITKVVVNKEEFFVYFFLFLSISTFILIFNLLLHVILRGLWIGALGLRYVSGEIDYEELKYTPKFTKYLKRKIGSFDKFIGNLENYSSIIFAISFLMVFFVFSVLLSIILSAFIYNYFIENTLELPHWLSLTIGIPTFSFMLLGMLFTFIDFLSQGFLKKKKWLSKIYFPFYRVFSVLTLSFLYRPLIHNFLDNKFGKRVFYVLIPFYLILMWVTSLQYKKTNYFHDVKQSSQFYSYNKNYEDILTEKTDYVETIAIPSKVIKTPYLKIFITDINAIENRIYKVNKGLKPKKDKRGLLTGLFTYKKEKSDSIKREYLNTVNQTYKFFIDSVQYQTDFTVTKNQKNQLGFETYLNIKKLKEGKHILYYKRVPEKEKDTTEITISTIPFWYFKD